MLKAFYISLINFLFMTFTIVLTSCSYEKTSINLGSEFDSTWTFSNSTDYEFDENLVEVIGGKAQLKVLELEHSGEDFNSGNHVGSSLSQQKITISDQPKLGLDVRNILPSRTANIKSYWKFEGSSDSEIGSKPISLNGNASLKTDSKVGSHSISFVGTGDYGLFSSIGLPDVGAPRTIAFWFNLNSDSSYRFLSYGENIGPGNRIEISYTSPNNLSVGVSGHRFDFPWTFSSGWNHFSLVFPSSATQSNEWVLYVNGLEVSGGVTGVGSPRTVNTVLGFGSIGTNQALTASLDGYMDEVIIFDSDLSSNEVFLLYDYQSLVHSSFSPDWTPKYDDIVGYWKMDGNWQDSSGKGNHGLRNGGAPEYSTDKVVGSNSALFDGVDDNISITDNDILDPSEITISAWVKSTSTNIHQGVIGKGSTSSYRIDILSDNRVRLYDRGLGNYITSTALIESGEWYHISAVGSSVGLRLYINGTLSAENSSSYSGSNATQGLTIGNYANNFVAPFIGFIDEVSIWNSSLSPSEINIIYNRQKQKYAGHYDSEIIDLGSTTSNWPDLSWSTSLPFGKELVGDFDNDGNPDSESSSGYSGLSGDLSEGLVAYWDLNEVIAGTAPGGKDFKNRAADNYHGDLNSGSFGGSGLFNSGLTTSQNRVDGFIDITEGQSSFTFSAWAKSTATGNFFDVFARRVGTTGNYDGLNCYIHGTNGLFSCRRHVNGSSSVVVESTETHNNGEWLHFVFTYDGSTSTLYINGKLEDSLPDSNVMASLPGRYLQVGEGSSTPGTVDEPAIWSRALNPTEVQQLYRRGANRVKLQVKSCVDSSCNCKSYGAGGSETDCDGDTIINTADTDDIHKSEFIGPGGDGTTYYSEAFNRTNTEVTFNCALNITDSDAGVCAPDEITLTAGPKPTGPEFLNIDYTQFVTPPANRYAQYRVYMEADDNTACGGEPCLPELTSVSLNPTGNPRYSSEYIKVKPKSPITFTKLLSAEIDADPCATFRLSRSNTEYYFDGASWALATTDAHRNPASEVESNIIKFASDHGVGELEVNAYLRSDTSQSTQCSVNSIDVKYE